MTSPQPMVVALKWAKSAGTRHSMPPSAPRMPVTSWAQIIPRPLILRPGP